MKFIGSFRLFNALLLAAMLWQKGLSAIRQRPFLINLLLFGVALTARLAALGRYVTPDELAWVYRSVLFSQALRAGDWVATLTTGHPGVTITWLGSAAIQLQQWLQPADTAVYDWITHLAWFVPDNMLALQQLAVFLTAGRIAVLLFNTFGLLLIFWLAQRQLPYAVALLGSFWLAVDPFFAGLSGLMHLDAAMTTLIMISLLSLTLSGRSWRYTAVAGVTAALALLTKSPAVLLSPLSLFYLLVTAVFTRQGARKMRQAGQQLAVWIGAFFVGLWGTLPALWTSFSQVLAQINSNASRHIGEALRPTFFAGQVTFDHGPLFYPVAIAYRLSPLVFLGLILSLPLIVRQMRRLRREPTAVLHHPLTLLLAWSFLFTVGMTLGAKKYDRYALPALPGLIFASVYGWRWLLAQLTARRRGWAWLGLTAVAVLNLLLVWPYPLAAYNVVLGGPWAAQRVLTLGWGESIGAATRWLEQESDTRQQTAVAAIAPAIAPFFSGETLPFTAEFTPQADYIILTANDWQVDSGTLAQTVANGRLLHTVRFGGLPQAWVYAMPTPQPAPSRVAPLAEPIAVDGRLQLVGSGLRGGAEAVQVALQWRLLPGGANGRYRLKLTLHDSQNVPWQVLETELLNDIYFYPENWSLDEAPVVRYRLDLPPGIPPDAYHVSLTLFDDSTGGTLPLTQAGAFVGTALPLGETAVSPPANIVSATRLQIEQPQVMEFGDLQLLGSGTLVETAVTGSDVVLDVYWQAQQDLAQAYGVRLSLGDSAVDLPLSRWATTNWRAGEVVHEKYRLTVPTDVTSGSYPIALQPLAENGDLLGETAVSLGTLDVTTLDRLYTMPDVDMLLQVQFGDGIVLRGVAVQPVVSQPGGSVQVTLYWQVTAVPPQLVSAFVHLYPPDGANAAQSDQWPGGLPTDLWANGQIIVDEHTITLPEALPPGVYEIGVGLYTTSDGVRLTAVAEGLSVADNRVTLPVPLLVEAADE